MPIAKPEVATRVDVLLAKAYDPDPRVRRTTQALADAGYAVRILAWDRSGKRPVREWDGKVEIRRVGPRSRAGRGLVQLAFFLPVTVRFLGLIARRRPAVLHAVDLPMLGVAGVARMLIGRTKLVYDAFEIYELLEAKKYPRAILRLIGALERSMPRSADLVIVPSDVRKAYLAARSVPSVAIGNWIDPPARLPRRDVARSRLELGPTQFCIVYAGALNRTRDLEPLLAHAQRVPQDVVMIAGRGEMAEGLARRVGPLSNVRFLGWLSDPTELYVAADALYYAIRADHPYAATAAPNNLYVAIAYQIPMLYRPQGELALIGGPHRIGEAFDGHGSLDEAIERLRLPEVRREIRAELSTLAKRYRWAEARRMLLSAYPAPNRLGRG